MGERRKLYCGWICPHFSVVEMINGRMRRTNRWYWLPISLAVQLFPFVWAVGLLTCLLPPTEVYPNLWHGTPVRNQSIFLTAATIVLSIEFGFARHLLCRYGCGRAVSEPGVDGQSSRDGGCSGPQPRRYLQGLQQRL